MNEVDRLEAEARERGFTNKEEEFLERKRKVRKKHPDINSLPRSAWE